MNKEEMVLVAEAAAEALEAEFKNYERSDHAKTIMMFMLELRYQHNPHAIASPAGVEKMIKTIFSSDAIRDFVLGSYSRFILRNGTDNLDDLVEAITEAAGLSNYDSTYTLTPIKVHDRLASKETLRNILRANSWMIIIFLMINANLRLDQAGLDV